MSLKLAENNTNISPLHKIFHDESFEILDKIKEYITSFEKGEILESQLIILIELIQNLKGGCTYLDQDHGMNDFCQQLERIIILTQENRLIINKNFIELIKSSHEILSKLIQSIVYSTEVPKNIDTLLTSLKDLEASCSPKVHQQNMHQNNLSTLDYDKHISESGVFIENEKIEQIMVLASELVAFKNSFQGILKSHKNLPAKLTEYISELNKDLTKISEQMITNSMELRTISLETIFSSLEMIVQEISMQSGKLITLKLETNDLKINTNIANNLLNSIKQIIHFSCIHSIETPQDRVQKNKFPEASLQLNASLHENQLIIEVSDNGRNLDLVALKSRAICDHLIGENEIQNFSEYEIINLLFNPKLAINELFKHEKGFETNLSQIYDDINNLGGSVQLKSDLDTGIHFTIQVPLQQTVIIEQSIIVRSENILYAVPMKCIADINTIKEENIHFIQTGWTYTFREENIPLAPFNMFVENGCDNRRDRKFSKGEMVVIIQENNSKIALSIDEVIDQLEAIVRPFGKFIEKISGLKGSFLLPDEKMAYVIDPIELVSCVHK